MSETIDPVGAAPETQNAHFLILLFGTCAAPIFWVGQLILSYVVTADACFPGDHPVLLSSTGFLFTALMAFDAVALLAAATGGVVSWRSWNRLRGLRRPAPHEEGRDRFLAVWGLFSSLWFFCAIVFNTIASITVTPCLS